MDLLKKIHTVSKNTCSKHSWLQYQFRPSVGWESSSDLNSKEYISNIAPFIFKHLHRAQAQCDAWMLSVYTKTFRIITSVALLF